MLLKIAVPLFLCVLSGVLPILPASAGLRDTLPPVAKAVSPAVCWAGNGRLAVSFDCPPALDLPSSVRIRIEPVYRDGARESVFPSVVYLSRKEARYFKRRQAYGDRGAAFTVKHLAVSGVDSGSGAYHYADTLTVGGGEAAGTLAFRYLYSDCCSEHLLSADSLEVPPGVVRQLLPYPVLVNRVPLQTGHVTFLEPQGEPVKRRQRDVAVYLHFRQGKWDFDPRYMANRPVLDSLDRLAGRVLRDTAHYRLLELGLQGYASPEGRSAYNRQLSERRAASLASYMSARYRLGGIRSEGRGEDWAGLYRLAEADSLLPSGGEVLAFLEETEGVDPAVRKASLEALCGGRPYQYMYERYFPKLRRIVLHLRYEVSHFSASEAEHIYRERPEDLDNRELYRLARRRNTDAGIAADRSGFGREYEAAAERYPDDPATLVNAASAALVRYDMESAYRYLMRVREDERSWNNIGVYYLLCGDTAEALRWFERAQPVVPEVAGRNLRMVREMEEK